MDKGTEAISGAEERTPRAAGRAEAAAAAAEAAAAAVPLAELLLLHLRLVLLQGDLRLRHLHLHRGHAAAFAGPTSTQAHSTLSSRGYGTHTMVISDYTAAQMGAQPMEKTELSSTLTLRYFAPGKGYRGKTPHHNTMV